MYKIHLCLQLPSKINLLNLVGLFGRIELRQNANDDTIGVVIQVIPHYIVQLSHQLVNNAPIDALLIQ